MTALDRDGVYRLLREIKRLAATASLTGTFRRGNSTLVDVYNKCLQMLEEMGELPDSGIFIPLEKDAGIDEVGIRASLLAALLKPEEDAGIHAKVVNLPDEGSEADEG